MMTGRPLVADASVVMKLLVQQSRSAAVEAVFARRRDAAAPLSIVVPDLLFIECANALWRYVAHAAYPLSDAVAALRRLRLMELHTTPTAHLMEDALRLAARYGISGYDACYVALAAREGGALVTDDGKLVAKLVNTPHQALPLDELLNEDV